MSIIMILGIVLLVVLFAVGLAIVIARQDTGGEDEGRKTIYQYGTKKFFLTRAEHDCYDALVAAVGSGYYIFPQVHLPAIVDNKIVGQNWNAAFRHINGKSVDFVLCDKAYISPKLAIELDDKTHERPERKERDIEVERVLSEAGLPLLRIENRGHFNPSDLAQRIKGAVVPFRTRGI